MDSHNDLKALGIGLKNQEVLLFSAPENFQGGSFGVSSSKDGLHFQLSPQNAKIAIAKDKSESIKICTDFRTSRLDDRYILTYKMRVGKRTALACASSTDLISWEKVAKSSSIKEVGMIASDYKYKDNFVMYFGEENIRIAFSKNLKTWKSVSQPVLEPRKDHFDNSFLELASIIPIDNFLLVLYYVKRKIGAHDHYSVGAAIFDKRNPQLLLWRTPEPIWEQPEKWSRKKVYPLGALYFKKKLVFYWQVDKEGVFAVFSPLPPKLTELKGKTYYLKMQKFAENPIIKPIREHSWESKATFNAAAIYEDEKVHFLYRAIGDKDVSVLGYASSSDGLHIDERSSEPVYIPTQPFECPEQTPLHFTASHFISGGGYGGCEDPRITKIDDRLYMTYVAFDGWNPPRVALTSIKVDDFLNKNWCWEKPKLISRPGEVNKNACILPEKIKNKYVVFHRVFPNILIDFVDDLDFSDYLEGKFVIEPRKNHWDSLKIGVGAPPLKTKDGWLLIYQSVGYQDRGRYKIGAMLLDAKNPAKVLCRTNQPIIEPTEKYENEGHKSGVAYPCGATIVRDRLYVYYGGADTVVCAASKDLHTFLHQLKSSHVPKLEPIIKPLKFSSLN